jgi:hypothetical protein
MTNETKRTEYVTRDAILKMLSDDEVARVSMREGGPDLTVGDEYLDLEHLKKGVLHMQATTKITMGEVIPRSAVQDATWTKICTRLGAGHGHH